MGCCESSDGKEKADADILKHVQEVHPLLQPTAFTVSAPGFEGARIKAVLSEHSGPGPCTGSETSMGAAVGALTSACCRPAHLAIPSSLTPRGVLRSKPPSFGSTESATSCCTPSTSCVSTIFTSSQTGASRSGGCLVTTFAMDVAKPNLPSSIFTPVRAFAWLIVTVWQSGGGGRSSARGAWNHTSWCAGLTARSSCS